jgi:hypothetical protein
MAALTIDLTSGALPAPDAIAAGEDVVWAPLLDLPEGAEMQPDGSVRLNLDYPVTLAFRGAPGATPGAGETIDHLTLRRLTGADVVKVLEAPGARFTAVALAASTGFAPARVALLTERMDASDMTAAGAVVAALLDTGEGLPERAHTDDDGSIVLPLLVAQGERTEIVFKRITGADLQAIGAAKVMLPVALSRAARMPLPEARALFAELDGADAIGVSRIVGFLSGSGRMTGR